MERSHHVLIIGAGVGGLSAAIRLRAAGWHVTIIEQNPAVGGKMSEIVQDGFRWDTGPSVITMRHVFEELFAVAGKKLDDYLTLLPVDPITRYFYPDGTIIEAHADLNKMAAQIEDVEGYRNYLDYAERIYNVTSPVFIYDQPPTFRSFTRVPLTKWLHADPFRTMDAAIRAHVKSPHLRQLLGRFATYVGGSPYEAPATLNVIAHIEMNGGIWYPQGGIYAIARALEKLACEMGVTIQTGRGVKSINVENRRVTGITLDDGTELKSDVIVANVDVTTVYDKLLPAEIGAKRLKTLKRHEPSCSGFVMLLGVEGVEASLAHHNIFFSGDYPREFEMIFKQNRPADEPTIYAAITSKSDPDHAPAGHENWFILVNAPPLSDSVDWSTYALPYRDLILDRLASFGFDLRGRIRSERLMTPLDLQQHSGAFRGALYGASANSKWTAFRRPHNRCKDVRGLYFAGGTTHPGGGVPMVTLSGKVAASMIMEDYG